MKQTDPSPVRQGAVLLTFDDRNFNGWLNAIPLFAKYGAHASFFFSGEIDAEAPEVMRTLRAAGHTVGLHTVHHKDAPEFFEEHGGEAYFEQEILPQLRVCQKAGIEVTSLAYPNNKHTPETDRILGQYFKHFRAGRGSASEEEIFPLAEKLSECSVMHGNGVGEYYHTEEASLLALLECMAREGRAATFFSHDIYPGADFINMPTELLETILAACERLGLRVIGFDEV